MQFSRSEKEMIRLIAQGDEQAFEELFRSVYARLVLYAAHYMGDRQEAENIVQMVFIKFWEKRRGLKVRSLSNYLTVSVRNACLNELRRQNPWYSVDDQFHIPDVQAEEELPDEALLEQIREAIDQMPPQRRKIFKMGRFEGLKYKEIASKLGISPKTVEVQMGKALKTLREMFGPEKGKGEVGTEKKNKR
ncbi:MAG: RNA polymerase sigma-70 factor [Marinilabiliaceae bacterium]